MPAYHSSYNQGSYRALGNMALLPIKSHVRGPAPPMDDPKRDDVVDEALNMFKANIFYRNFEFQGNGDRVLCYLILYITDCLQALSKCQTKGDGLKRMNTLGLENFTLPGDPSFAFGGLYHAPATRADSDLLRQYITQLRQEVGIRLCDRVFVDGPPSKWWLCFSKRKFMNKSLSGQ
jgi:actin related protein 2/3 complex subunit 3